MNDKTMLRKSRVDMHLCAMLGSYELVDKWWNSPNRAFAMSTPDQIWQTGEDGQKEVAAYVYNHSLGAPYS